MQKNKFIDQQLPYLVLVIIAILFVVPLLWVLLASLDANPLQSIKIPQQWTLDNYVEVLTSAKNQLAFANGLFISLAQALIVVALAALAAYPLSRYELKHKRMFMFTILFMTSLPVTALMVPVYHLFLNLHLYDNRIGVILFQSASSLPYAIWMMKNFMDSVPMDLEEAAWVDGATIWQGIRRIVTPLMLPGLCMVGVYTAVITAGKQFTAGKSILVEFFFHVGFPNHVLVFHRANLLSHCSLSGVTIKSRSFLVNCSNQT